MEYSQKIARLEEILGSMERNVLPLEKVLELYQEGQKLVAECRDFLTKAEGTIKKLEDDGTLSDFEPKEDA
ncbi:MAG: exodeoxyribonuclease VII small subunit [Pyramidobacter sp.]|nr:exodeoxyribonuclease VII small subunit [Pyramidobacter sp.]MBQ4490474.1 exodeoxyribonuclease VII small subunit [Pyramidobacter sp.]MBQ8090179.1 exodeoxyribonuclease VII small subunit [Pyramidobacter sp.]MBR0107744.1 exodeoxyribonuclease VII small subunit [Pyramidobacter sp.]MBR1895447.1 exodeoxyribonuclease VII small subunit [Pyramidobacter sp.]